MNNEITKQQSDMSGAYDRMLELIGLLNSACVAYYKHDKPIMSDHTYDTLYDELESLEKSTGIVMASSPTQKVQGYVLDGFKKVKHSKPMLSAAKTKNIGEIKKFLRDSGCGNDWYMSGKLDGLTVVLRYIEGKFAQGITRGNGTIGEDITDACRFIPNIPLHIPYEKDLEIRGECVISWEEFDRINSGLAEPYSHPRNLAAGTLRQLDLNVVKDRHLSFMAFECVTNIYDSKLQELDWLSSLGFETVIRAGSELGTPEKQVTDITQVLQNRGGYPYDGIIFEVDSKKLSASLGMTGHHYGCRMALKWADDTYETTLRDIEWQVGKTGVLTPVAVFDEVDLGGALTTRATLHNLTNIKELELGIGDTIEIYRANLVIPQVADNLTRSNSYEPPQICPVCGALTQIRRENDTEFLMCTNQDCAGKLLGKWCAYVSKKAMNIDGLSEQTLKTLLKRGYIDHMFISIYSLADYKHELYKLDGFGKKSIDNMLKSIEASKYVDLAHFIVAFSIPGIGEGQAKLLAAKFGTFEEFAKACDDQYDFSLIPGIGNVLRYNIIKWWVNNNWQMTDVAGVVKFHSPDFMNKPEVSGDTNQAIFGKTFVVTGSVHHFKNRDELKAYIESKCGKVTGSVSGKTDYLINNDTESTSGKNKKAKELNIPIISEEQFLDMIQQ